MGGKFEEEPLCGQNSCMSTVSSAPAEQSLAARILDRHVAIALLLSSFVWVLPWSRTFQLSVLVLAITSIVLLVRDRQRWWAPGAQSWCTMNLLAAAALALSAAFSDHPGKPLELAGFQLFLLLAGMPVLIWARDDAIWRKLQLCLFAIIGFWIVDGLFQAMMGFDLFGMPRTERLGGYFSHPDKFGFYISMLCAWVLFAPPVRQWSLPLQSVIYLLCLAITIFGNTRAGWVSFILISAVWLYLNRGKLLASPWLLCLVPAGIAVAGWWLVSDPQVSKRIAATIPQSFDVEGLSAVIPIRAQLWAQAWTQFMDNLWLGTGAGNYMLHLPESWAGTNLEQPYTHQVVLEILAGSGIIGSLLFIAAAVVFFRLVWRADYRSLAEHQRPLVPLLILACAWFPVNTHRELFSSEMMVLTWMTIALVVSRSGLSTGDNPRSQAR